MRYNWHGFMSTPYPRKQTIFIFFICIIAIAAVAFYVRSIAVKNKPADSQPLLVGTDEKALAPIITDTDWKKSFFNDSTSTGAFKTGSKASKSSSKEEPLTATDILGQNFFTRYVELRQLGLTKDTQAVADAANQVIAESVASVARPKVYSMTDIKVISSENNPIVIKSYAESLMNILKSDMPEQNEAEIAMNAFEKGDMALLSGIDHVISGYQSALNGLISTPAPQPLAQYHLDLLNAISMQTFNAKSLRKADTDPVTALAAISLEVKSLEALSMAIGGMQNYFTNAGVTFVPPISGSILQSK